MGWATCTSLKAFCPLFHHSKDWAAFPVLKDVWIWGNKTNDPRNKRPMTCELFGLLRSQCHYCDFMTWLRCLQCKDQGGGPIYLKRCLWESAGLIFSSQVVCLTPKQGTSSNHAAVTSFLWSQAPLTDKTISPIQQDYGTIDEMSA